MMTVQPLRCVADQRLAGLMGIEDAVTPHLTRGDIARETSGSISRAITSKVTTSCKVQPNRRYTERSHRILRSTHAPGPNRHCLCKRSVAST